MDRERSRQDDRHYDDRDDRRDRDDEREARGRANDRSNSGGVASGQLRSLVERIERLEEDKQAVLDDIKEVYGEAKGNGFDVKVLRKLIGMRKRKDADRQAEDAILDVYLQALGMI
jgi:uncharacterized protein (UPF0335 family)